MPFFNSAEPILRGKQEALDIQDRQGLLQVHWTIGDRTLLSLLYTRIDQIFVVWGWTTALIFFTAQFMPIDWRAQAIAWSGLTLIATVTMAALAWFWVRVERLRWVVYSWSGLMLLGIGLTDYGIFHSVGPILVNLCPLWLGLSAVGYVATGWGLRSRTFYLAGLLHGLMILVLPGFPGWQFLVTGLVIAGSLLFLAEVQWDMRPPVESDVLTDAQKQFNREQHRLRQRDVTYKNS